MLKIDFSIFICYYLCSQIAVFLFFWLSDRRVRFKQKVLAKEQVLECPICQYVYFEPKVSKISVCPLCGSLNDRKVGIK